MALKIALLGSGIMMKESLVPSMLAIPEQLEIVAIYSRKKENAEALLSSSIRADIYHGEIGEKHDQSLAALLARKDIDAVIVALPISMQPDVIRMSFQAGKHVFSEKPIGPDENVARKIVKEYNSTYQGQGLHWSVGENYRHEPCFEKAREIVESIGPVMMTELRCHCPMPKDNKFAMTEWRKTPDYIGSFLLDGGVHFIAAMRKVCKSEKDIQSVQSMTAAVNKDVAPPDTLISSIQWNSGCLGSVVISYAVYSRLFEMTITCAKGQVIITREAQGGVHGYQVEFRPYGSGGSGTKEFFPFNGVDRELVAFAKNVKREATDENTPFQAQRDVEVIAAMLKSASTGERILVAESS